MQRFDVKLDVKPTSALARPSRCLTFTALACTLKALSGQGAHNDGICGLVVVALDQVVGNPLEVAERRDSLVGP